MIEMALTVAVVLVIIMIIQNRTFIFKGYENVLPFIPPPKLPPRETPQRPVTWKVQTDPGAHDVVMVHLVRMPSEQLWMGSLRVSHDDFEKDLQALISKAEDRANVLNAVQEEAI